MLLPSGWSRPIGWLDSDLVMIDRSSCYILHVCSEVDVDALVRQHAVSVRSTSPPASRHHTAAAAVVTLVAPAPALVPHQQQPPPQQVSLPSSRVQEPALPPAGPISTAASRPKPPQQQVRPPPPPARDADADDAGAGAGEAGRLGTPPPPAPPPTTRPDPVLQLLETHLAAVEQLAGAVRIRGRLIRATIKAIREEFEDHLANEVER